MRMSKSIDFRVRLRTSEALKAWTPKPIPQLARYVKLYNMESRLSYQKIEETIEEMGEVGINRAVLCSGSIKGNKFIRRVCRDYPDVFFGIAGVKPEIGVYTAFKELRKALKYSYIRGFNFGSLFQNPPMAIDDEKLYPLYALCVDFAVPAIIHSSLHYYTGAKLELNSPFRIDNLAVDFPELKIVMSHAGNGFGNFPLVLAQRHSNVYLEVSGLVPKYLPKSYIVAMNKYLKDKFIFGTDYPLLPFTVVGKWMEILEFENRERFFRLNAEKVLFK